MVSEPTLETNNDQWRFNGEGGIRTHEGVTPTRFRVVRDQPDSATLHTSEDVREL